MNMKKEMKSFLHELATYHAENGLTGLPALLLKKGLWFEGRADSEEYATTKKWKKKRKPKAQDCFYNSQEFCAADIKTRYFEGFVLVDKRITPSEHAWIVMPDGRVVDFTLEALEIVVAEKGITVDSREAVYVGLEVPKAFIVERLNATDWYDSIVELFYADQIQHIADGRKGRTTE
jgi:hypothetical protein